MTVLFPNFFVTLSNVIEAIYNTSFMHCWGALAMRAVHSPPLQPLFTRRGQLISPIAI